ncbi:EMC6-like membrane protein, partial [Haloarcula argentinensis]
MATETADGMSSHMRGLSVTTLTAVAGIAAAFGSNALAATPNDPQGVLVLAVAIAAQFPICLLYTS